MSEKRLRKVASVTHEVAPQGRAPNGVERRQMYLYAGGLGMLEGAKLRAARNLNMPMVTFSLLARCGYYDQIVYEKDGMLHMGVEFIRREYQDMLEDTGAMLTVDICGKPNQAKLWKLPGHVFDTVDLYLLDTDFDGNGDYWESAERTNTRHLYGGPKSVGGTFERKIAQDMVLGVGTVKASEALGLGIEVFHMQESHTVFTALYLLERELPPMAEMELLTEGEWEKVLCEGIERIKPHLLYTNHTPDKAGNFVCGIDMIAKMYRGLSVRILRRLGEDPVYPDGFNFGAACLRLSRLANAVSKKHLEVTKAMFSGIKNAAPIIHITNGSLIEFFQDQNFANARTWGELRSAKMSGKRELNEFLRGYVGKEIDINVHVSSFCRRFAIYKRPDLLLTHARDWLIERLSNKAFYLIMSGKPHPDDYRMVSAWTNLLRFSKEYPNLIMVPNYDMRISKIIKAGSDTWLNTPEIEMEASGTSGQTAASEGAVNVSMLDGWMDEADKNNFFPFGTQFKSKDMDVYDANSLIWTMDHRVFRTYYDIPEEWYKMALRGKFEAEQHWNADRMMKEYMEKMYTF